MELTKVNDWDESSFYFGSPNCYLTQPARKRDRYLLSRANLEGRGKGISLSSSDISPRPQSSEIDDDVPFDELDFYQDQGSEEDTFIDLLIPSPLQELSHELMREKISLPGFRHLTSCGESVLVMSEAGNNATSFMSAKGIIDNLLM